MLDVEKCKKCTFLHHMDAGESCMACSTKFCCDCALEQGFWFSDIFGGTIFVCKDCIREYKEKGIDWLRGELFEEFEEKVFLDALNKFEDRERGRLGCDTEGHLLNNQEYNVFDGFNLYAKVVELDSNLKRGQRLAVAYASKYICDCTNRDVAKITDEALTECFKECVVPAKVKWYPYIRMEIEKIINEAHGKPIGAEIS